MNIGFEAKRAYTNGTGLGHYSRTLVSSLATYYPDHEYFLFTPKHTNRFNADAFPNVHVVTPQRFPGSLLTSAWRSSWVKKDLKQLNIDIYHGLSHEIPVGMPATGIPSVVTIHDLIFERYPKQFKPIDVKIYRKKFSYACKNANRVIAISNQTKEDIMSFYGTPASKIDVCYQSCNPIFGVQVSAEEKQRVKELYKLPDQFYLYVGSVIERKNLLTICKALKITKQKNHIPLVVIGDGDYYKKTVTDYIRENGLEKDVIFLSDDPAIKEIPAYRSAADFPAIYQQAVCMIYPSIFEGFGIPVLEALFSAIPVITSNVSCLPEAAGDAGLYVDPYNEAQMADAMQQVIENRVLRNELIEKGLVHAQQFTQEKCAAAVMNVYKKVS